MDSVCSKYLHSNVENEWKVEARETASSSSAMVKGWVISVYANGIVPSQHKSLLRVLKLLQMKFHLLQLIVSNR